MNIRILLNDGLEVNFASYKMAAVFTAGMELGIDYSFVISYLD